MHFRLQSATLHATVYSSTLYTLQFSYFCLVIGLDGGHMGTGNLSLLFPVFYSWLSRGFSPSVRVLDAIITFLVNFFVSIFPVVFDSLVYSLLFSDSA